MHLGWSGTMRTRPDCREASSEPRWSQRCSLPAMGLRGQVEARGSEALPAECSPRDPQALGTATSLRPGGGQLTLRRWLPRLLAGRTQATSLVPQAESVHPKQVWNG